MILWGGWGKRPIVVMVFAGSGISGSVTGATYWLLAMSGNGGGRGLTVMMGGGIVHGERWLRDRDVTCHDEPLSMLLIEARESIPV